MKTTKRFLTLVLAVIFAAAAPLGAFTLVEGNQKVAVAKGDSFRIHVRLAQAALGDGSVRFEPGEYDVEVLSKGDGSVRGSFFDKTGRKAGEANGIIAVLKRAAAKPPAGTNLPAVQSQGDTSHKVAPSSLPEQAPLTFARLGFGPNSRWSFEKQGQKLNLEIISQDGTKGILIGLLVPAVQKAREAANKPH